MSSKTPFLQNLDTTFVNLWSLLRKLTAQGFIGRVHVDLGDYSADIFLNGSNTPLVREIDRATNSETIEEGALHRVVLRTRESAGLINVFSGADEATVQPLAAPAQPPAVQEPPAKPESFAAPPVDSFHELPPAPPIVGEGPGPVTVNKPVAPAISDEGLYRSGSFQDWPAILATSGELIGAVERGVNATGHDFSSLFHAARLELADDYTFLDPFAQTLQYANGIVTLKTEPAVNVFVNGLSEALRRTVNAVAVGDRARRVRERVALEMLPVARAQIELIERSGWRAQLDRIAGTVVM
jgi:hypothetical protein